MFMTVSKTSMLDLEPLRASFVDRLLTNKSLARYTAARVGGPAAALLEVYSVEELSQAVNIIWKQEMPFLILGGGSNILVSDAGYRGVVLLNRAKKVRFSEKANPPTVWAESGANISAVARQAARIGLAGLEWASSIPGTVGGAVVGNAGAYGGNMAGNLLLAEILHLSRQAMNTGEQKVVCGQVEIWPRQNLEYSYRSSVLKTHTASTASDFRPLSVPQAVVLSATLQLENSTHQDVQTKMDAIQAQRRRTQPPGASMGSMFKNPAGDFAGRLIEEAGLKGIRVGDVEISPKHANFFINRGQATAKDIYELIKLVRRTVAEKFAVELELEIELVGEWNEVS